MVIVVDIVIERRDDTVATGVGLAGVEAADAITDVAIAIEVAAVIIAAADIAGVIDAADVPETFAEILDAADVRLHHLVARIDRQGEAIGQSEARRNADIAGVGRVGAAGGLETTAAVARTISTRATEDN